MLSLYAFIALFQSCSRYRLFSILVITGYGFIDTRCLLRQARLGVQVYSRESAKCEVLEGISFQLERRHCLKDGFIDDIV